jgi:adenosine deaminase
VSGQKRCGRGDPEGNGKEADLAGKKNQADPEKRLSCRGKPAASRASDLTLLPKFELHVHLEGTVRRSRLEKIARRNGVLEDTGAARSLEEIYRPGSGLPGFLGRFKAVCGLLRAPRDFYELACDYASELVSQTVLYAEIHLSLQVFTRRGIDRDAMLEAIHAGFEEARRASGIRLRLILDGVRQWGPEMMRELLDLAEGTRRWGVVGIGLGGDETSFPPVAFCEVYRDARDRGWKTTVHAGEVAGADAVLEVVDSLRVDRIEHGIRAAESVAVLDRLASTGIGLDFCPTSQRQTGAIAPDDPYPLREFLRRGIPVTIGSDDPALFITDLTAELQWLRTHCELTPAELVHLQANALSSAFLPASEFAVLAGEIRPRWRVWLESA